MGLKMFWNLSPDNGDQIKYNAGISTYIMCVYIYNQQNESLFINNLDSPQTNGDWHYGYIQLDPDPQDESIPPPTFDGVSMVS